MPAGCVQCPGGEWQCGSDTSELCAAAGGWTPAGALCLQFFVRKHPESNNCIIRIKPTFLDKCDGEAVIVVEQPKKKAKKKK